ncbi:SDR family NAD(P)-dependent oxidoreductase [Chloroflexota bacterium]
MSNRLKDKVAIVTGSGIGIGRELALAMAKEGAKVVTNNRKPGNPEGDAKTTAQQIISIGGEAIPFFGDISDFETSRKLINTALDTYGSVDILMNNAAGYDERSTPWELSEEGWDNTIRVHLKGTFNCIRHALGFMKNQRWGRIINTTSRLWLGTTDWCNTSTADAGIVGLTRAVAKDVGRYGVTCNAYAPRARTGRSGPASVERFKRDYELGLVDKRMFESIINRAEPEAMPPIVVYLATEDAANINGQVFGVMGGEICIFSNPVEDEVIKKEEGFWTLEELIKLVPTLLLKGYRNPAPPDA